MRVSVIAVGRGRDGPDQAWMREYTERFDGLARNLGISALQIVEVEEKRPLKGAERKRREAELIEKSIPEGAHIVILDESGKQLSSRDFAGRIQQLRDDGIRDLVFVIGGADGLDQSIRQRAGLTLAFGKQTWPHMMVRLMLAEQLYRSLTILAGHPYHKA